MKLSQILVLTSLMAFASVSRAQIPAALSKIGVAGGVRGLVQAFSPGEKPIGRMLASGQPLYLNEKITTDAQGSLQVMLLDETVFTIGPNSSMVLDEFVYDPKSHHGKVTASITNGVFRFVTGQIGHKQPSDMKVKFPAGTMGIRGTIVAGQVSPQGTTAVLLGPGPATNASLERVGAFRMENAGAHVDVVKPGYGTFVAPNAAPTPPALVPLMKLNSILQSVSHAPTTHLSAAPTTDPNETATPSPDSSADSSDSSDSADNSESGSATDASGQGTAQACGDLSNTESIADLNADLGNSTLAAANDIGDSDLSNLIANNQASWDDVRSITDGTGYYSATNKFTLTQCNGGACTAPTGTVSVYLNIDFGNKTIGGAIGSTASNVTISANDATLTAPISDSVLFAKASFLSTAGLATLQGVSGQGTTANISLLNIGQIAGSAAAIANYNSGGTIGAGSVVAPLICTSGTCH